MTLTPFSKRLFALAIAMALLLCPAMPLHAQTAATGTITGTVMDGSGAVVANASVLITDTDTGVTRTVPTTGEGICTATFLQPGHYEVVVSAPVSARSTART